MQKNLHSNLQFIKLNKDYRNMVFRNGDNMGYDALGKMKEFTPSGTANKIENLYDAGETSTESYSLRCAGL